MKNIRIRMYRVGFGDCFLLSFPDAQSDANRHVLVDCGVHPSGTLGKSHIQQVVDNIKAETGGKLAVIVASHAHADHVSGFAQCLATFNEFDIAEIWLPWVDDPTSSDAIKLRRGEWNLTQTLDRHFKTVATRGVRGAARTRRNAAIEAVANLKQTEPAMNALRSGFASQVRPTYLRAGVSMSSPGGISGLQVEVLGPPPESNKAALRRMDPPTSDEYLRIADPEDPGFNAVKPFGKWWRKEIKDVDKDPLYDGLRLTQIERDKVKSGLTEQAFDAMAMKLDDIRNNTSLVLLLRFRGKTLLFPGDAQYGNWQYWITKANSTQTLDEIDFLKVAHHGSHNASPKSALDKMRKGIEVMVSTQSTPFPSIPKGTLIAELIKRSNRHFVRSDWLPVDGGDVGPDAPAAGTGPRGFTAGAFWYDLKIPV